MFCADSGESMFCKHQAVAAVRSEGQWVEGVEGHHTRQDSAPRFIVEDCGQLNALLNSS